MTDSITSWGTFSDDDDSPPTRHFHLISGTSTTIPPTVLGPLGVAGSLGNTTQASLVLRSLEPNMKARPFYVNTTYGPYRCTLRFCHATETPSWPIEVTIQVTRFSHDSIQNLFSSDGTNKMVFFSGSPGAAKVDIGRFVRLCSHSRYPRLCSSY